MPKQKAKLVRFTFKLPPADRLKIEQSIRTGTFLSQSQALRFIAKHYITERRMAENAVKYGTVSASAGLDSAFKLSAQKQTPK